jgi:hypothetical protein
MMIASIIIKMVGQLYSNNESESIEYLNHSSNTWSVHSRMAQRRPYVTRVVDIDTDTTKSYVTHACILVTSYSHQPTSQPAWYP